MLKTVINILHGYLNDHNNLKTKTIFVALIAVALIPLTIMSVSDVTFEDPTMPDKVPDKVIQIQKSAESQAEINDMKTVENLLNENMVLTDSLNTITEKYENVTIPQDAQDKMNKINKRLSEVEAEFDVLQQKSIKLYALTPEDEKQLNDAKDIIRASGIPYFGLGIDSKVGALAIGFQNQSIADTYIPQIEQLIDVPYYLDINPYPDEDLS